MNQPAILDRLKACRSSALVLTVSVIAAPLLVLLCVTADVPQSSMPAAAAWFGNSAPT